MTNEVVEEAKATFSTISEDAGQVQLGYEALSAPLIDNNKPKAKKPKRTIEQNAVDQNQSKCCLCQNRAEGQSGKCVIF